MNNGYWDTLNVFKKKSIEYLKHKFPKHARRRIDKLNVINLT